MAITQVKYEVSGDCRFLTIRDCTDYGNWTRADLKVWFQLTYKGSQGDEAIDLGNQDLATIQQITANIEKDGWYRIQLHIQRQDDSYLFPVLQKDILIKCRADKCRCALAKGVRGEGCNCHGKDALMQLLKIGALLDAAAILFSTGDKLSAQKNIEAVSEMCAEIDCGC